MTRCMALSVAILTNLTASGQLHLPYSGNDFRLAQGAEQYSQNAYSLSRQSFTRFLAAQSAVLNASTSDNIDRARYYTFLSGLKLQSRAAVDSAEHYLEQTNNPVYQQRISYALGQHYFQKGAWLNAIPYYENANIANLSNREIADSKFELAYCYFNNKQFDEADILFASIKEIKGRYYAPGNYYYGLLAYNKGNYDNALKSFDRIQDLPEYNNIVPYYIAELHYFKGNRAKALDLSLQLIKRPEKLYYDNELYLLAAQCYFEDKNYSAALPYFEHYYNNTDRVRKEEIYKMGYCYYQTKDWSNGIEKFKELSSSQDSLGQTAMYLLGDCYLKAGDKKGAKNAFSICAEMPYNPAQQEAALLLSGKLAYEAGYNSEGSMRIRQLLHVFPDTRFRNEARTLLSDHLLKSGNYAGAYELLQEVSVQDAIFRKVWQKAAYGYALQQMQNQRIEEAALLLDRSLEYPENSEYAAAAWFWKGEIAYRKKNYNAALEFTRTFMEKNNNSAATARICPVATRQHGLLNIGYAYMGLQDYDKARQYFGQARQAESSEGFSAQSAADALLREADAAFLQKDYVRALALYNKAIGSATDNTDYATFQKGIILGLQGKFNEKEALLRALIADMPSSEYIDDAYYELGENYLDQEKFHPALEAFKYLTTETNGRVYAARAWMKIGYCYQEMGNDEKAVEAYKNVIVSFPSSELRPAALDALKSIYVSNNRPGEYISLLKENGMDTTNRYAADSVFYAAAEAQYASAKYAEAAKAMGSYLEQYPNGLFAIKAHFYKAESHYQSKETDLALKEYDIVTKTAWNDFTEASATRAAVLAYNKGDYAAAEGYYNTILANTHDGEHARTAYRGLMLSAFYQKNATAAAMYADSLLELTTPEEDMRQEIYLVKGKIKLEQGSLDEALELMKQASVSKSADIAAEAMYHVAGILLKQNKIAEAETAANKAIQQTSGSPYWNTKSYLVMADVFVRQKDYFNAKATLQSLVKNVKIEALRKEAAQKLEQVKAMEQSKSKLSEE